MEAERERREPQSCRGEPASPQVADDDAHARNAMELPEHARRARIVEVVQRLRAHHDVHGPIRERQCGRVAAHGVAGARATGEGERLRHVDRDEREVDVACVARAPVHEPRCRQRRCRRRVASHCHSIRAAGLRFRGARHACRRTAHSRARHPPAIGERAWDRLRCVEVLEAAPAWRRDECGQRWFSDRSERSRRDSTGAAVRREQSPPPLRR